MKTSKNSKQPEKSSARLGSGEATESVIVNRTVTIDEIRLLSAIDLFSGLDRVALAQLAAHLEEVRASAGATIVSQGESSDGLYVIASGELSAIVRTVDGRGEATVNRLSPGDYFGEMALLTGSPRSASVRTSTDAVLLRLDQTAFKNLLQERPGIGSGIIRTLSERLRQSDSARVASDAALESMLACFLESLAPNRREPLLDAALLNPPTYSKLSVMFGPATDAVWHC